MPFKYFSSTASPAILKRLEQTQRQKVEVLSQSEEMKNTSIFVYTRKELQNLWPVLNCLLGTRLQYTYNSHTSVFLSSFTGCPQLST